MKFDIRINDELEGFDIIELDGIRWDEGNEDAIVATFYDKKKAIAYVNMLNS